MMSINIKSISFLNIHDVDYHCVINEIRKYGVINVFKMVVLSERSISLYNKNIYKKMSKETILLNNIELEKRNWKLKFPVVKIWFS